MLACKKLLYFAVNFIKLKNVKKLIQYSVTTLLLLGSVFSACASFSALYAFGDGVCTTTSNNPAPSDVSRYYGHRESNGRVWIEVLAQRQGLTYDPNKNLSYFGNYSSVLVGNINNTNKFIAPTDATNDLFIVWVCDADFVYDIQNIYPSVDAVKDWNPAIGLSLTNHFNIITNLYAKGVRTLIMPNAVDITEVPYYNQIVSASDRSFVRGRVAYFNTNLNTIVNQAKSVCPGLKIYVPDIFSLLDDVLANAGDYGLTNARYLGQPIAAMDAFNYGYPTAATNGYGTNYIFWDYQDPTAKMHAVIADYVQQIISPVRFSKVAQVNGSNRLDVVNLPVGLNGYLDGSTNPVPGSWTFVTNFNSLTSTQSLFVATPPLPVGFGSGFTNGSGGSGGVSLDPNNPGTNTVSGTNSFFYSAAQFYRLRFPFAWNWP